MFIWVDSIWKERTCLSVRTNDFPPKGRDPPPRLQKGISLRQQKSFLHFVMICGKTGTCEGIGLEKMSGREL